MSHGIFGWYGNIGWVNGAVDFEDHEIEDREKANEKINNEVDKSLE